MKYILIILILVGCNAEKRCQRHMLKAKSGGCIAADTVVFHDTIKGWEYDTVFRSADTIRELDTFVLHHDNNKVRTVVKWKTREVIQKAIETDTIFKHIHHTNKEIQKKEFIPWWVWLIIIAEGVVILGLVFRRAGE